MIVSIYSESICFLYFQASQEKSFRLLFLGSY